MFIKLSVDWNAEPNAPEPELRVENGDVILTVLANSLRFSGFAEQERLELRFSDAARYRLGPTNDEGWSQGQCRFSGVAPAWGEFYEIIGDARIDHAPADWHELRAIDERERHFLFYLRDSTFECSARAWSMRTLSPSSSTQRLVAPSPRPILG